VLVVIKRRRNRQLIIQRPIEDLEDSMKFMKKLMMRLKQEGKSEW